MYIIIVYTIKGFTIYVYCIIIVYFDMIKDNIVYMDTIIHIGALLSLLIVIHTHMIVLLTPFGFMLTFMIVLL